MQSSSVSSDFTSKLLNLENPSPADNEIASLMDTTSHHEEPGSHTSSLYTVLITTVPEITSVFTITIPPPPPFFNPLPQQATPTPTPTPTASETTTSFPTLLDFAFVSKFNERVTNLENDMSEMKQVDQYAQALSSIPAIVDRYIDKKLREAIQKAIQAHNLDCRQEAQDEKREYIELVDTSMREAVVLTKSSSQPKSTYEAAASLSESDRGTKRRKSSKEAESSRDSRSKENKSSSTSKGTYHSQHKSFGKSAHAEEPSHIADDSGVLHNQEFNTGNNDEQPADKEASNILTSDILIPGLVKFLMLKNLILPSMSSWIHQSTSLHLS
ncbi:hypothetical protein Tco_1410510 [Tanacetum coccineum]|uniref:Inhibitor of growth protein N-terminal histone-binding domain-containing protein n=1 Tax=Tanacetum coccineum TaxID=301880 RepID=A0ABQ4YJ04_9ASTR